MFNPSSVSDNQLGGYYAKDDYYLKNFADSLEVFGQGSKDKNLGAVKSMDQREFFASLVKDRECKAHDLTFSPPKSLSVMWAIGTDVQQELALYAHRAGVARAMEYIEKNLFFVQRKQNNIVKTYEAGGMVALSIDHSVSRPVEAHGAGENDRYQDPQIHSHVLLANAAYALVDKKKINRSVNFYQIYRSQKQIDRIYKMAMRRELQKAGCKTRKTENGFELVDISDAQNRHFSNRAIQVENNLADKGLTSAEATGSQHNAASLKGRLKKVDDDTISSAILHEDWKDRAAKIDIDLTWVPFEDPKPEERDEKAILRVVRKAFQEHVAINSISTRGKAIYDVLDLAETAHEDDPDKNPLIDFDDIIKHLPAIMKSERMIRLPGQKENQKSLQEQFVSVNLMLKSQENYQYLIQGKGIYTNAMADFEEKMDAMAKDMFKFTFEGEQRDAAIGVLASQDLICGIQGDPGTGKTTIMEIIAKLQGNENMVALSCAGTAAMKLGTEIGVEAKTIAKFLLDWKIRDELMDLPERSAKQEAMLKATKYLENLTRDPSKPGFIIVDEASMTGDMDFNGIARIARKTGSKIILAGDINQLPTVQSGEVFKKFVLSGHMETFKLKNIMRQKDKRFRGAVEAITKRDDAKGAVDALNEIKDAIKVRKTAKGRIDLMVRDYMEIVMAGEAYPMVITGTNDVKDIINDELREKLKTIGKIEAEGETHLVKCGSRGAKREKEFCVNDRIIFLQNDNSGDVQVSSGSKVLNGSQAVITSIKNGLVHGYLIDNEGESTNVDVCFDLNLYNRVSHALCITEFKSQGQSVGRKIMYHAPSTAANLQKQNFLVGISRNKLFLSVYTDNVKAMIKKVSRWAHKNDAYQAFKTGYSFSGGQSKYVRETFKVVEDNQRLNDPIMAERQAVTEKYGKLEKAPRAIRDSINERLNESRSLFIEGLKKAQGWANNSSHLSEADNALLKAFKAWEKDKNKALKHFDRDKNRNKHITYYRALNRCSSNFCKKIMDFKGHQQSDEILEETYREINAELTEIENQVIFPGPYFVQEQSPAIEVIEDIPIIIEEEPLSEEDRLHDQLSILLTKRDRIRKFDQEDLTNMALNDSSPDYQEKNQKIQNAITRLQNRYDNKQEEIDVLKNKIEGYKLAKDGALKDAFDKNRNAENISFTQLPRIHSIRKFFNKDAIELDGLIERYNNLQENQKLLAGKLNQSESLKEKHSKKLFRGSLSFKKKFAGQIKDLEQEIQIVNERLDVLNPDNNNQHSFDGNDEHSFDFENNEGPRM